jgi:recombinational DNA repair protein (RecF pathway)
MLPFKASYSEVYGLIIEKSFLSKHLLLLLFTPNRGFIRVIVPYARGQSIKKHPPIKFQQLNLIEGILKPASSRLVYQAIEQITLKHNFIQQMPYANQWVALTLLKFLSSHTYLESSKEIYSTFMMSLKYLDKLQQTRSQKELELLTLSYLLKWLLLVKIDPLLKICSRCHKTILSSKKEPFSPLYVAYDGHFFCESCVTQYMSPNTCLTLLSKEQVQKLHTLFLKPFEDLINLSSTEIEGLYPTALGVFNPFIQKNFSLSFDEIIGKNQNPFF